MKVADKYVVVNADDFGYSDEINEAIIEAHRNGILSSTSLMVTAEKAKSAVELAKENPSLGVGLHLVLCCGKSALNPEQIPNLVNKEGLFHDSAAIAGLKYQFIPSAKQELKREIKAQLDLFRETGLKLSHVDGHLHLHTHPIVIQILAQLAPEYQIKFIRLPYEELNFTLKLDRTNPILKIIYANIFRWLRKSAEKPLSTSGVQILDRVYGLLQTGNMSESYLLGLIPQIKTIYNEIYFHPQSLTDQEYQALCSQKVQEIISTEGFKVVNYFQLGKARGKDE
ncbi:hopanoid biosynthesis-associated protein HpnK [Cyanobacterium aponinum FACHB-4101]|uniref:hopanoid biosynthesis-associated protein HpnK n=1 Tax=Cyanobacterium aponinum TaxID=379064 RepID=UPI001680718B|nr:hopanoid biosynthesis-associated protein HpnK [Cyanobacterium aponinum FACHB-4101]